VTLVRRWEAWRYALAIVQPATVIRWHREGFKRFWTRRSRAGRVGRPALDPELVGLIRKMSKSNVTWGAPRIRNELGKLGIEVAVSTIARYMMRQRNPPSPTWRAFLDNHVKDRAPSSTTNLAPVGARPCRRVFVNHSQPPLVSLRSSADLDQLKAAFNEESASHRVIALLSPT